MRLKNNVPAAAAEAQLVCLKHTVTGCHTLPVLWRAVLPETMRPSVAAQPAHVQHETMFAGEGGAGTWSDGKLTTKVGRNSDPVRRVLHTLYTFGAPQVPSHCIHTWCTQAASCCMCITSMTCM